MKNRRRRMKLGTMSLALATLALGLAVPALAQSDPATTIMMCDSDNDKAVSQKEWDACGAPTAYPKDADKNHDGQVSVDELKASQASGSKSDETAQPSPDSTNPH
jgi:hypothetical protein